jgi:hypothetical protein
VDNGCEWLLFDCIFTLKNTILILYSLYLRDLNKIEAITNLNATILIVFIFYFLFILRGYFSNKVFFFFLKKDIEMSHKNLTWDMKFSKERK